MVDTIQALTEKESFALPHLMALSRASMDYSRSDYLLIWFHNGRKTRSDLDFPGNIASKQRSCAHSFYEIRTVAILTASEQKSIIKGSEASFYFT